jgi:hypothetical protein
MVSTAHNFTKPMFPNRHNVEFLHINFQKIGKEVWEVGVEIQKHRQLDYEDCSAYFHKIHSC